MKQEGIVYLLTNEAMPNLVKIGMTTREEIEARMGELYTTGVPLPFECAFAGRVEDANAVEKAFHQAFDPQRINPRREFFEIAPEQAISLLNLLSIENVTPQVNGALDKVDEVSRSAARSYKKKRPQIDFLEMGIGIGEELVAIDYEEVCTVVTNRKVLFHGEETSLTRATKIMLGNDYNVAPGPYWTYQGKRIRDIYNETYPFED